MRHLFPLTLSLAFLLAGCNADGSFGNGGGTITSASGDTSTGASLYAANCAGCHGSSAQGGSGPALAGISDSGGVVDVILYGTEGMPGFAGSLSDADISDILAYLGSLGSSGGSGGSGGGGDDGDWDDDD